MDVNGDGEVTEADFALWGPLFAEACKRPNAVGAMVDVLGWEGGRLAKQTSEALPMCR